MAAIVRHPKPPFQAHVAEYSVRGADWTIVDGEGRFVAKCYDAQAAALILQRLNG